MLELILIGAPHRFFVARSVVWIVCFVAVWPMDASDWPRWRGAEFNGTSKETGWSVSWPQAGPKRLWKSSVGTGFSSVAVSHERLYTLGNQGGTEVIYGLDANTGKELWRHSY